MYRLLIWMMFITPMFSQGIGWKVTTQFSTDYNTNILGYSEKYKTMFINGEESDRFKISSLDDIVVNVGTTVSKRLPFFRLYKSRFLFGYTYKKFVNNPIKNSQKVRFKLQFNLLKIYKLSMGVYFQPYTYVRHYKSKPYQEEIRMEDLEEYIPFSFKKWGYLLRCDRKFSRYLRGTFIGRLDKKRFSDLFPNHSSDLHILAMKLRCSGVSKLMMTATYEYGLSEPTYNKKQFESMYGIEVATTRYSTNKIELSVLYKFLNTHSFSLKGAFTDYEYLSRQPRMIAPMYKNRIDQVRLLSLSYTYNGFKNVLIKMKLSSKKRISDETEVQALEKNYHQTNISLGFRYVFKL